MSGSINLSYEIYDSELWRSLAWYSKISYLRINRKYNIAEPDTPVRVTYSEMFDEMSQPTFGKAVKELHKFGFIELFRTIENTSLYTPSNRWEKYGTGEFIEKEFYPPKKGYVYLIESQGVYKIGITKQIKERVNRYTTENPFPVKLILSYKVENCLEKEEYLLSKFKDKNIHGEWFKLSQADVKFIQEDLEAGYGKNRGLYG